jgi:hypothetical protein
MQSSQGDDLPKPCSVCAIPALAKFADANTELSASGLSKQAETAGMNLSADRIQTHRKHRADEGYLAASTTKKDLAILIRDKVAMRVETEDFDVLDRNVAAGLGAGLKAQALIDKRDAREKKMTQAEGFLAILSALRGEGHGPTVLLEDPNVIDGVAVEIDAD